MNVTNGRCGSVAGAQQLIFIYRDVADRRHVRFVTKKCRTCFRESYVTVHSVHSNALRDAQKSCFAWFRAAILGFSVNFVHKKRLAERDQW